MHMHMCMHMHAHDMCMLSGSPISFCRSSVLSSPVQHHPCILTAPVPSPDCSSPQIHTHTRGRNYSPAERGHLTQSHIAARTSPPTPPMSINRHFGRTSAIPRPHLGRTSAAPPPHAPRPHLGRTHLSNAPRPHLGRASFSPRLRLRPHRPHLSLGHRHTSSALVRASFAPRPHLGHTSAVLRRTSSTPRPHHTSQSDPSRKAVRQEKRRGGGAGNGGDGDGGSGGGAAAAARASAAERAAWRLMEGGWARRVRTAAAASSSPQPTPTLERRASRCQ